MPDAPPGHEWVDNGSGELYLRRAAGMGPTGENIPRLTYDPNTGGFKLADTDAPFVPWNKVPDTPSARLAQGMGYPEAPPGYIWSSNQGTPYLRRAVGMGATGQNIPEIFFDPQTGRINYSDSGQPFRLFWERMNVRAVTPNFNPYQNWTPPLPAALQQLWKAATKNAVVKPLAYGIPVKDYGLPELEKGLLDRAVPAVKGVPSSDEQRKTQLQQERQQRAQQQLTELYANLAEAGVVSPNMDFDWNQFWVDYQKQHPTP
jgi:uncharacterized protein YbcV (DUF1398 family)